MATCRPGSPDGHVLTCYNTRELVHCRSRPPLDLISWTAPVCRDGAEKCHRRCETWHPPGTHHHLPSRRPLQTTPESRHPSRETHRPATIPPGQQPNPACGWRTMGRPSPAAMSPEPMCVRCTKFMGSPIMERSIRLLLFFCGWMKAISPLAPPAPQHQAPHPRPAATHRLWLLYNAAAQLVPEVTHVGVAFQLPSRRGLCQRRDP